MAFECTLTETNARGRLPVCSCGWVGSVHPIVVHLHRKTGKRTYDADRTAMNATGEWRRHYTTDHAKLVPDDLTRAVPGLTRLGRFGHS